MASVSELTTLIDEMDAINQLAASFQAESAAKAKTPQPEQVTRFREIYLDWYARSLKLLNETTQQMLRRHYSGGGYNIHDYISDPASTGYAAGSSRSGSYRSPYHYWKNEYNKKFKEPFNQQRLLLMQVRANVKVRENTPPPPPPPPAIDTIRLHPRVKAVSAQLFKDKHYRQAILRACLALNEAVQQRSGRSDLDGVSLMSHVFSQKTPILRFPGHPDEQQGYMWLFSGVTMAIRNPRAHKVGEAEDLDANEALELLALISALFRALDGAVET